MSGTPSDPHLGHALAHAPDRDAAPPQHLSAQILAAAHREAAAEPAKARLAAEPVALPWWRKPWGASGALATVLMAGFVGLLWRGEPPGPAVDGPAPAAIHVATVPPPASAPAPAVAAPQVADTAPTQPSPVAPGRGGAAAAVDPVQAAHQAVGAQTQLRAKEVSHPVEKEAADKEARALRAAAPEKAAADQAAMAEAAMPAPAPSPTPTPTPTPAPARLAAPAAAAPTAPARAANFSARPLAPGLPDWQPGDQLAWDPASAAALPTAAGLRELAILTQAAWARSADAPPAGTRLLWQRNGAAVGALQWEGGRVWWCAAGQMCLRADVPPDALRDRVGTPPSER